MESDFEKELLELKKPYVSKLGHEDMLSNAIINSKRKAAISVWWLSIPAYVICALLMWHFYHPGSSLGSALKEFINKDSYLAPLIFVLIPLTVVCANIINILNIYSLHRNKGGIKLMKKIALHVLFSFISFIIMIIFLLL